MKGKYGDDTQITWKDFEKDFQDKYVSDFHVEERMREILDLSQQEDQTVDEFEQQFIYPA